MYWRIGGRLAENRRLLRLLFVAMFFLWFSWFGMSFDDPHEMNLPFWARYTDLAVLMFGLVLFAISHLRIGGLDSDKLITSGICSKTRHPMYSGFIIWLIGLPIFLDAPFVLASAVIWIPHILYWRMSEERQLGEKYQEYSEYKRKTWF